MGTDLSPNPKPYFSHDQRSMETAEARFPDYALGPPWLFRGSALYQLHLVKAKTARAFIPKNLRLVEAFGYTLGGFFLAHYDDSPAGKFDELVVIGGLVWNTPTSCAWAARVVVNNNEACRHGQKEIGLPSHVGIFSKKTTETIKKPVHKRWGVFEMIGIGSANMKPEKHTEVQISETMGGSLMSLCNISLPFVVPKPKTDSKWMGPRIKALLPSFSGQTIHNPHLLKYSCQIDCRVRGVKAAKISGTTNIDPGKCFNGHNSINADPHTGLSAEDADEWNQNVSILLSKPLLALEFNLLKMQVDMPTIVDTRSSKKMSGRSKIG